MLTEESLAPGGKKFKIVRYFRTMCALAEYLSCSITTVKRWHRGETQRTFLNRYQLESTERPIVQEVDPVAYLPLSPTVTIWDTMSDEREVGDGGGTVSGWSDGAVSD